MLKIKVSELVDRYEACPGRCKRLIHPAVGEGYSVLPCGVRIKVCVRCYHILKEALQIQEGILSFDPCGECNLEGKDDE